MQGLMVVAVVREGYGLEIDMWAVGVILYILLCGFPPFRSPDRKQSQLFQVIKEGKFEFISPFWDNNSKSAHTSIVFPAVVFYLHRFISSFCYCNWSKLMQRLHAWSTVGSNYWLTEANVEMATKRMSLSVIYLTSCRSPQYASTP